MLGMISFFLYSLITKRAFLHIKLQDEGFHAPVIEHAYKPSTFNWISPEIKSNFSFCLWPPYDGDMHKRLCDRTPQPFFPTDQHNSTFFPFFMVNSYQEEKFWHGDYRTMFGDRDSTADVQLFASNRGNVYRTFFNPHHNASLLQSPPYGFHKENAFACFYQYLFRSKAEVCQGGCQQTRARIRHLQQHRTLLAHPRDKEFRVYSTMIIAIQIRDPSIRRDDNVWFHCADALAAEYRSTYRVTDVYYLLINAKRDVQQAAKDYYHDKVLFPTGDILAEDVQDVLEESVKGDAQADTKKRAVLESARDWDVMAEADVHVVSSRSGFGVMGAMMRVRRPQEYRLYNVRDEKRQCTVDTADDLLLYTTQWSGL